MAEALKPRSWPTMGSAKPNTSQLVETSQLITSRWRNAGTRNRSQAGGRRCAVGAGAAGNSRGTACAIRSVAAGSKANAAKAARKPKLSISTPASSGPIRLATAGARATQLKMRMRSVPSRAIRPAVRCTAIMPKPDPAPHSAAAAHSASVWPLAAAIDAPHKDSPAAMRTGRW